MHVDVCLETFGCGKMNINIKEDVSPHALYSCPSSFLLCFSSEEKEISSDLKPLV